ncbi:Gfo/Idh/MocA family oxidoreductase [Planctomycetales bacterium ZRK34]|nr:Gfo/Idh/MocA family oxidoreductase [Planctomycetales bacterium ZRK34]
MSSYSTPSRRRFIGGAAALAAAPMFVPQSAFGANDKVQFGCIGLNSMGNADMKHFLRNKEARVVAVCDIDSNVLTKRQGEVNKHYNDTACTAYKDFREVMSRPDIDAVLIGTPDHWHGIIAMTAIKAGKDVYCEKPITHTFAEGLALYQEANARKTIWQTGSWQRSQLNFRLGAELVRNGVIGKLKHVEVGLPTGKKDPPAPDFKDPPSNIDYDFWIGPSKMAPYDPNRLHWSWRWWLNIGGGQLMDWIGHHNDIAHWGMDQDYGGPVEAQATGFEFHEDTRVWDAPINYEVKCRYASGATTSISNKHPMGTKWIGEDGWVYVNRGGRFQASNPDWTKNDFLKTLNTRLYESRNHWDNFVEGVKTRKPCVTTTEISHRSIVPGHLGMVSQTLGGRKLNFDPAKQQIVGDDEAQKLLMTFNPRGSWKL